ncbi:MAG: hypothetical protein QOE54_546 [Streptosporangiaceae bacterium]|jgi:hypothetical protein|nr:hypothetical protein [Streptosporangiaceae bacterium]MDX6428180.1 hypothetical protein [Streptosporangiaceae bacterium]
MAGYSGTPLPKKLGIRAGHRVLLVNAPAGLALDPLPPDVEVVVGSEDGEPSGEPYDVILGCCPDRAALIGHFDGLRARMRIDGGLWLGWPKKSSGVPTDLTETDVREYGLAAGLVDNKVCAIDETWSGLRFVVRLADRK